MDEFPGLLARDFGFRPPGKSAPMAASKGTGNFSTGGTLNFGMGSGGDTRSSFSSSRAKSGWNLNPVGGSFLDDHGELFNSTSNKKIHDSGGLGGYSDVFGGPPKFTKPSEGQGGTFSFNYDSIFQGSNDLGAKSSSLPVYDDDIFDGVPGLKSSSSVKHEDLFSSIASPPKKSSPFDDLNGHLGRKDPELKSSSKKRSGDVGKDVPGFDDLIPGFGGSSPPKNRATSETSRLLQSNVPPSKSMFSVKEDPFVVLESTSTLGYSSSGLFTDPLEQISKTGNSRGPEVDGSSVSGGVFDDIDPLNGLGKSASVFSSEMNNRGKDRSPLRTGPSMSEPDTSGGKGPADKPSVKASENHSQKKVDMSPRYEENLESADDVWLTVSEIPLFTQPTSAPPPTRPPPFKTAQVSNANRRSFASVNAKKKVNEFSSFRHSTQSFHSPMTVPDAATISGATPIDELEDFSIGMTRNNADQGAGVLSSEEEVETNSGSTNSGAAASAAAMKEAMEKAEAKFKHAREVRERENAKAARSREAAQQERDEKALQDTQERELREKQQQKEREEKEREQRRLEKKRERAREIEREREKARQAVERATKEARERAAAEARLKAERASVGKANAEARERAERAAVQRAQAEARERAAVEARERAERAAADARERANAEARERAAVARAEAEVQLRAERAAVERAAAEARERAAAEARERAAAARNNQQKNENDLESFFGMGARPNSAPRPRASTSDPVFDTQFQSRGGPEGAQRMSAGTSSSMRKASSTKNTIDDLTSIFGGSLSLSLSLPPSLPLRILERNPKLPHRLENSRKLTGKVKKDEEPDWIATKGLKSVLCVFFLYSISLLFAKALAEKNHRDLQTQREQAERHRIGETLDIEIKRWSAGKEGNLRALLSTLQYDISLASSLALAKRGHSRSKWGLPSSGQLALRLEKLESYGTDRDDAKKYHLMDWKVVLWTECGWQPVSLTDLITSASVKKVYRKATLCIHPDKVQQKGANLEQKYIAEKVFDLLKEAWNKFNSEELF
ncbi:hypothetical protein HHK36_004299 [Tetracentron sinense]|uniref:J domain-containing protein n=1 Tax=Tetracentron sinense TaxID=13715 RepID=A0A834ZZQ1_TETSI|nr:hypothetical protein HHK36_004299 [Tetracentron sinense]